MNSPRNKIRFTGADKIMSPFWNQYRGIDMIGTARHTGRYKGKMRSK